MTRIINFFRRNLPKKIIALIAAFCMWVFVMNDQDPPIEGSYAVPLTISNAPYEFVPIFNERTIQIELRAPRSNFVNYNANAFRVYANLEGKGEGEYQIEPQVVMPQGFELIKTKPDVVDIKLDPLIQRQMPVDLITTGKVASDAAIKEIRPSIDVITLVGPKSFVEQVQQVLGTLNFSGNSSSFDVQISLNAVDKDAVAVPMVHEVPSVITVAVDIESGLKKKIVPVVPELSTADGWEVTKANSEPAQVEIIGAESVIAPIISIKTVPFTVQTGQRNFKGSLKLDVPEGVTVKEDEVTVTATIVRKPVMRDLQNPVP